MKVSCYFDIDDLSELQPARFQNGTTSSLERSVARAGTRVLYNSSPSQGCWHSWRFYRLGQYLANTFEKKAKIVGMNGASHDATNDIAIDC